MPPIVRRAVAPARDKVRATMKVPDQCCDNVNAAGVKILQSEVADAQDHFEQNQQHHNDFEQYQAAIARDVKHQHQRVLDALQLAGQGGVAIDQIEFVAQGVVDEIHREVFPCRVGLVEQVEAGENFGARRNRLADEAMQRGNPIG